MNNEKKNNSNHKNSKRRNEKTKFKTDMEPNSSHNDSSSSTENVQKDLVEAFEKCVELSQNECTGSAIGELDNSIDAQKYECLECKSREPTLFHNINENLNDIQCSEVVNCASLNSRDNNGDDVNKSNNEILESNNNNRQEQNIGFSSQNCQPSEAPPINIAQLTYTNGLDINNIKIEYKEYESEVQMQDIMKLIQAELSEPYSIYTYRYFIYNWPKLCFLATHGNKYVGAIVCKLDMHMNGVKRGYIAMLAVKKEYRKLKIGTNLVQKAIDAMLADNADEVVLETEMKNVSALRLYENLGFVRDKRLFRYYLNGVDALRLKLWFN
ncbi:probable protein phosphatase DDB_G0279461 isoform X2 [Condylostylus longicornis]|uniref:probable protein phosphatase DDB_G0279461 isoform X2 n=1 Tax=Condylostylus longicornis TaxID=2530218 RepID=UPI00244E4DE3|nr:probable protein phosphatase DDB_G0279461 isoform X2 [Condylostylus longicornis]